MIGDKSDLDNMFSFLGEYGGPTDINDMAADITSQIESLVTKNEDTQKRKSFQKPSPLSMKFGRTIADNPLMNSPSSAHTAHSTKSRKRSSFRGTSKVVIVFSPV